jgi:hypothetical protein
MGGDDARSARLARRLRRGDAVHSLRRAGRLTLGAAIGSLAVAAAGCATPHYRERHLGGERCDFVVHNQTWQPLEVHVVRGLSMKAVGALNPGERLTESISCAERRVWVRGIAIPAQVGAPMDFGSVQSWADLRRGDRTIVALHWP